MSKLPNTSLVSPVVVQTGCPAWLQTQVLQSWLKAVPGLQLAGAGEEPAPGQLLGQNPTLPSIWSPGRGNS